MPSNRPKLLLDEQSFQGLLAAAFTIQEHNDRKKNGGQHGLLEVQSLPGRAVGNADANKNDPAVRLQAAVHAENLSESDEDVYGPVRRGEADRKRVSRADSGGATSEPLPLEARETGFRDREANEPASFVASSEVGAERVCSRCGLVLPAGSESCSRCSTEPLRPGERLQRNWASMWLMSQERGLWPESRNNEDGFPLSPADPGRIRQTSADPMRGAEPEAAELLRIQEVGDEGAKGNGSGNVRRSEQQISGARPRFDVSGVDSESAGGIEDETGGGRPAGDRTGEGWDAGESPEGSDRRETDDATLRALALRQSGHRTNGDGLNRDRLSGEERFNDLDHLNGAGSLGVADGGAGAEVSTGAEGASDEASRGAGDSRVILRFRRADLYLGIAIMVAIIALLWPAASAQQPKLSALERILIAVGVAEAPTPGTVHYHGDPNLRVWVDTHTALYYCPGDELYGKTAGGHYTTQHEAQSDQFEPAERSVCVE